ncbi:MAG: hypothetical protein ACOVK6_09110 [Ramlibacter sp.]|jgi:hypothetical protein
MRPLFWTTAVTLLAGETLALYLLCAQQVHRAEARRQLLQAQVQAFSDCLAYVNGSTIGSCTRVMRARHWHAPG